MISESKSILKRSEQLCLGLCLGCTTNKALMETMEYEDYLLRVIYNHIKWGNCNNTRILKLTSITISPWVWPNTIISWP